MRFSRNKNHVDILLCLECNILVIMVNNKVVGQEDFDNARPEIVQVLKQAFPKNELVQGLPERGTGVGEDG